MRHRHYPIHIFVCMDFINSLLEDLDWVQEIGINAWTRVAFVWIVVSPTTANAQGTHDMA
jgi:hypothetical protein